MTQTLKQGDRGALVSLLQLGLERAGQTPGALDGIFGALTSNPFITMAYMGFIGWLLSGIFGKGCSGSCNTQ